jgi:hypothetical protein
VVFERSWANWAVEVKTGSFEVHVLKELLELCRRNPKFTPLVITPPGGETLARRYGVRVVSWQEFLISGPAEQIVWPIAVYSVRAPLSASARANAAMPRSS